MISPPPKLRNDLAVSHHHTAAGQSFIVKDPVTGNFFRLREAEHFIAQQCDGETPLDVIRKRAEEKFEATLPFETLSTFVRNLGKAGLLESEETAKGKKTGLRTRVRGSLLYLRFKILDPDQLFNRIAPRVRFLFTPHFMVLSAALILLAVGISIAGWSQYLQELPQLYRLSVILPLLTVVFLVVSLHEFAHGLTCKHFGGEVHEIGFMLIYFQPALYCNVSDAWLFPERSKRLWVGFAGAYFELFLWALATLAWRLTDVGTWTNYLGLIVMTSSGIKTLLNFNPLIKLDGYYLLSDYLEVPNLRRKSFRYVGGLIKKLFGGEPGISSGVSLRERRIFLTYGLVASVCSFSFLAYVLVTVGGYLLEGRQSTALLLSAGLVAMKFRRRFRRLFGKPSGQFDESDDGDDFDTSGTTESPEPAKPKEKRGRKLKLKRWITWTAVAGATVLILFLGHLELRINGPFNVLPRENADVRAGVEGIIEKIYVDEGDAVAKGAVIARLYDKDLLAELHKTEAEITQTRANLKKLEAGPTGNEIEVARASVTKAEDRLQYAQSRLARAKNLFEEKLLSRKEYEDTADLASAAKNELAEAKGQLNVLLSGSRPEDIEATRAQIVRLETQRGYLQEEVRLLDVVSPAAGIVATPSRQLKEMRHQLAKRGDLIAKVYDFKTVAAQLLIPEKEIADIQVGQKVALRARAYPGMAFYGTVISIATAAQGNSSSGAETLLGTTSSSNAASANKSILVTTQIENQSLLLKAEMTGHAKIYCGQRRIIDLIMRRLARTFRVEFWSWW